MSDRSSSSAMSRGPVGCLCARFPVPFVSDDDGPAWAGGMRLGADLVPVAVAQVLHGHGPRHVEPVTVDPDPLFLELGDECGLGLSLGAGGAEPGHDVVELAG